MNKPVEEDSAVLSLPVGTAESRQNQRVGVLTSRDLSRGLDDWISRLSQCACQRRLRAQLP